MVFHPEAIRLSEKSQPLRNLLHATAVEGVHAQFGFYLGLTKDHAKITWNTKEPNQKAVLSAVRLLKGVSHKGVLRATVIRRKRDDFEECQKQYKEAEKAAFAEARRGPNPKETLAALSKYKRCMEETLARAEGRDPDVKEPPKEEIIQGKYKKPVCKVTHSSDFEMLNSRNDTSGEGPSTTRPTSIKLEISLPGIDSAAALDLDVTEKKVHLQVGFLVE